MNKPTHARYTVVGFMVTLAMVTYLDRACIGAMKTTIQAEFQLDDAQFSWIFFSFIFAYALFEIPTARWADRGGAKRVMTRIVAWWSVFTLATATAWNYVSMLVMRFLFGAGEAGAFPCVARVLSRWMPLRERGTAKGVFFAGAYASAAITTWLVNKLLPVFSWREILVAFGLIGFIWIYAWHRWFRDEPTDHPAANEAERQTILADRAVERPHPGGWPFWRRLLQQRNVRLLCLLYMPNCATFYFCITWLPSYLENQHGFKSAALGWAASLPLFMSIATQFLGGFLSDRLSRRFGIAFGRRAPGVLGYALAALFVLAASLTGNPFAAAILFGIAASTCMLTTAPAWSTCVDIGREHSGTVSAVMNTSGQIAAILSQPIIGYSLKWFGNWNVPFWLLAALLAMGAVCWVFVDPTKPVMGEASDPVLRGGAEPAASHSV